ncbi:hypothetical protein BCU49_011095 [Vibrio breoganii]|nr:hypothetical protein [Vibrio breoganii]PMI20757.1 hypothetical protein BCU49_06285 [Vibrio breoganii]
MATIQYIYGEKHDLFSPFSGRQLTGEESEWIADDDAHQKDSNLVCWWCMDFYNVVHPEANEILGVDLGETEISPKLLARKLGDDFIIFHVVPYDGEDVYYFFKAPETRHPCDKD